MKKPRQKQTRNDHDSLSRVSTQTRDVKNITTQQALIALYRCANIKLKNLAQRGKWLL